MEHQWAMTDYRQYIPVGPQKHHTIPCAPRRQLPTTCAAGPPHPWKTQRSKTGLEESVNLTHSGRPKRQPEPQKEEEGDSPGQVCGTTSPTYVHGNNVNHEHDRGVDLFGVDRFPLANH